MKNIIKLVYFIAVFTLGMITYRNSWFPTTQLYLLKKTFFPAPDKQSFLITPYTSGTFLFSDRSYFDRIGDLRLDSIYVLQIPRHTIKPIEIMLKREVIIYRLITNYNENIIFNNWNLTDIKVFVQGKSCIHTTVVSKKFNSGTVILNSGEGVASSPILIRDLSTTKTNIPLTILNKKYLLN